MSVRVVLDTNALMMPVECDVRLFEAIERALGTTDVDPVVPAATVDELDALAAGSGEAATAASVGRDLVDRCRVVETEESYADDAVLALADEESVVVTNDGPLQDRLLDRGVRVIGIRGRSELAVTRP